jgi:hypothetical protein
MDQGELGALHMFCLQHNRYGDYQALFHSWEASVSAPTFKDFQAWRPSEAELVRMGFPPSMMEKFLGGPRSGCTRWHTARLNDKVLLSSPTGSMVDETFHRALVKVLCFEVSDSGVNVQQSEALGACWHVFLTLLCAYRLVFATFLVPSPRRHYECCVDIAECPSVDSVLVSTVSTLAH